MAKWLACWSPHWVAKGVSEIRGPGSKLVSNSWSNLLRLTGTPDISPQQPLLRNCNKYPCFYIFPLFLGGVDDINNHQNHQILCQNLTNSSMKMPLCPRLHIHRKEARKFHPNESVWYICYASLLYQFKREEAAWKRLGCPECMQRTWWQKVATPYTGLCYWHVHCH